MRLCRYEEQPGGPIRIGIVRGDQVHDVSAVADELPPVRWPYPPGDHFFNNLDLLKPRMEALADAAPGRPVASVRMKSPVANPGKFICGAGNFNMAGMPAHIHPYTLGLLFKMNSAAAGESDGVELRWPERTTVHEMEIATVIGKTGTNIAAADALDHVAGYMIGLDMTLQGKEFDTYKKSFDSYGVLGPWMVTPDEIPDTRELGFWLKVNGEVRQQESVGNLRLGIAELIEYTTSLMTVHPGDVIFSGTPGWSVGPVNPGDVMEAHIDIIGDMRVEVWAKDGARRTVGWHPEVAK